MRSSRLDLLWFEPLAVDLLSERVPAVERELSCSELLTYGLRPNLGQHRAQDGPAVLGGLPSAYFYSFSSDHAGPSQPGERVGRSDAMHLRCPESIPWVERCDGLESTGECTGAGRAERLVCQDHEREKPGSGAHGVEHAHSCP